MADGRHLTPKRRDRKRRRTTRRAQRAEAGAVHHPQFGAQDRRVVEHQVPRRQRDVRMGDEVEEVDAQVQFQGLPEIRLATCL